MAQDYKGKVKFVAVDVDDSNDVAAEYKVEFMPTLVMIKDGKEIDRVVGADESQIKKMIEAAL